MFDKLQDDTNCDGLNVNKSFKGGESYLFIPKTMHMKTPFNNASPIACTVCRILNPVSS